MGLLVAGFNEVHRATCRPTTHWSYVLNHTLHASVE
jgi:hypothetical protein